MARPKGIPAANKGKPAPWAKHLPHAFKKGTVPWNKGLHHSAASKLKMRKARLGKYIGAKHPQWKGGVSRNKHSLSSPQYKEWRESVFQRDDYRCQNCGERGFLEAHHIKSWSQFPALRYKKNNGITYCRDCHILLDSMRSRFVTKQ